MSENCLPSDSRFRSDSLALKAGKFDEAEKNKDDLENL